MKSTVPCSRTFCWFCFIDRPCISEEMFPNNLARYLEIALLCLLDVYIFTNKYPNVKQLSWAINLARYLEIGDFPVIRV